MKLIIKPIADLRNYNTLLKQVKNNCPVFLTKYGSGKFVLLTMEDYNILNKKLR